MKIFCFVILFCLSAVFGHADNSFLLSSEKLSDESSSLKGINSFVFFFCLKMEKNEVDKTVKFIDRDLAQFGKVEKKDIFTSNGVDLECFANPSLKFSIERLVDKEGKQLPILRAELVASSAVQMMTNKEYISSNIGSWSIYVKDEGQDLQKALKETFSLLLKRFSADFQKVNGKEKKPTFFITYNSSLWDKQF
ncbi:MAG: hypothetical protein HYX48_02875 [Chlamydiales bacterium]|nr:hypothetical protein [Chlamydiales bacterium]